ncbi:MAG: DUF885 domain-containing protein [Cyclobacteriaceae bacterium]|nr:DUF885 family protein [Cyclobacteriaceae bacterium]MCH8517614.1 DUF885 domain-containing protein [Cyclobacteriaceae bacterium]
MIHYSITFVLLLITTFLQAQQPIQRLIFELNEDEAALQRKYILKHHKEYFGRFDELAIQYQGSLQEINFEGLERSEQINYLLLSHHLKSYRLDLNERNQQLLKLEDLSQTLDLAYSFIIQRRRADSLPPLHSLASDMEKVRLSLHSYRSKVNKLANRNQAILARDLLNECSKALKEAHDFYSAYHPEFSWWMNTAVSDLLEELSSTAEFLASHYVVGAKIEDESGIIGQPIGKKELNRLISNELIPYTAKELIDLAEKEYEKSYKMMLSASKKLGFDEDWKAAMEAVKQRSVPVGEQPFLVRELADEAVAYLEAEDLISVPEMAKETWRMDMMSEEWQKFAPFFLGGERILIAFPTKGMSQREKMMSWRGNNPHFVRAVVHHELIPGHHLQQFMNRRHYPERNRFRTPFWTEGWALYWELILWDKGFQRDAYDEVGMLFWRMHRAARIIFSLKYHLEEMSPQECIDLLVDQVGHEYENAAAEVRRSFEGNYGPLYQIAYMIGALQFYSLRDEVLSNGSMTEKEFHDYIITQNQMPIAMLRELILGNSLEKDLYPKWKFIDNLIYE